MNKLKTNGYTKKDPRKAKAAGEDGRFEGCIENAAWLPQGYRPHGAIAHAFAALGALAFIHNRGGVAALLERAGRAYADGRARVVFRAAVLVDGEVHILSAFTRGRVVIRE